MLEAPPPPLLVTEPDYKLECVLNLNVKLGENIVSLSIGETRQNLQQTFNNGNLRKKTFKNIF